MSGTGPIIHVITRLEAGGAPRSLLLLLEGLSSRGVPVELVTGITPATSEDLLSEAQSIGIPVHIIPSLRRDPSPWHDLRALIALWRLFRKRRPRLVHAHTSKAGFLGRLAALLAGVEKRVYSPRGTILEGYFTGTRRWLFTRLDRMAARWTDFIVGLTVEESNSYLEAGIGRPAQHLQIPIGIDHRAFEPPDPAIRLSERRHHSVGDEEVLIVTSGRLVPVKDHATLIKSLAILSEKIAGWRCWIFGSGPEESRIVDLIDDLGLEEHIRLWGFRADLAELLGLGDVFVLSSTNEGFGRSLLEAMSARLAIAATAVGGVPTVLNGGNAGLLCPPSDPEALASAVHRLVDSADERNRLASAGYERVKEVFSLDGMVEEHVRLYDSLLAP